MKFNIGRKIGSGYALALSTLIVIGSVSYTNLTRLTEASDWVDRTHVMVARLERAVSSSKDAQVAGRGFAITGEERFLAPLQNSRAEVDKNIAEIKILATTPIQQRGIAALEPLIARRFALVQEVIDARRKGGVAAAEALVRTGAGQATMDEIRKVANEMAKEEQELLAKRSEEEANRVFIAKITIVSGIAASLALLSLVGFFLTRNISGPLAELSAAATQIASGNLAIALKPTSRTDELGNLVQAFARMTHWLEEMAATAARIAAGDLVTEVKAQSDKDVLGLAFEGMRAGLGLSIRELQEAVNVLSSAASEILASTSQVATGAGETGTAVAETTTAVEQVKQTAKLSSEKARLVSDNAQEAMQRAKSGSAAVDDSISGMERIQEQMGSIAGTVVRLSEQSETIGEIVATVTDLAEQSNLLAVNAGIEAARAGEQGKGFAVVAQEVKALAQQSKEATGQVRTILSEIQKAIGSAVMATELGSKTVDAGVLQVGEAREAIRSLGATIEEAAQAASQIAASSQQQSAGMDQIAMAMESIRQASLQNTAGSQQTEGAARNLHEIGQKLKDLAGKYKV